MQKILISILLLLVSGVALADDPVQAEIRLLPAQSGPVWVGQEIELYLELWSTGLSFGHQSYLLPAVQGAYLLQADSSTVKLSENRHGTSWQGLRYYLLLYPQKAGQVEVPSFDVRFSVSAGYRSEPVPFVFPTDLLEVETRLPPGTTSGSLLVTTSDFSLSAQWKPEIPAEGPLELEVGDALSLVVERRAADIPGMVFSPLPETRIPGLALYVDAPEVNDRIDRGALTGRRTDRFTYILEREGQYTLPQMSFQWYDPRQDELFEDSIPQLELVVSAGTAFASGTADSKAWSFDLGWWIKAVVLLALLFLSGRWVARRVHPAWNSWRLRVRAGEPWAFRQLQSACKKGQAAQADAAIAIWLKRLCLPVRRQTLMQFAQAGSDPDLIRESVALQSELAAGSTGKWNGSELAKLLKQYRVQAIRHPQGRHDLPPLNP